MLRKFLCAILLVGAAALTASAAKPERRTGTISSEVTTGRSALDGTRDPEKSEWTVITVPNGYVINEDKTVIHYQSRRGTKNHCDVKYGDYVEVIPGSDLKQPTTIKVRTSAWSKSGPNGTAGKTKVKVKFEYVRYRSGD